MAKKDEQKDEKESKAVKLVKMVRKPDDKKADVHPDEVQNFEQGGFLKVK